MRIGTLIVLTGLVLGTCFALSGRAAAAPTTTAPWRMTLDQKIAFYARQLFGQKIGNGQCTEFVSKVLATVGAKPVEDATWTVVENGKVVKIPSYSWGTHYAALGKGGKPMTPKVGNIIQFESCRFEGPTGSTWNLGTPHHTAIVESANGTMVTLLNQNMEGDINLSKVRKDSIDLKWLKAGHYKIYAATLP